MEKVKREEIERLAEEKYPTDDSASDTVYYENQEKINAFVEGFLLCSSLSSDKKWTDEDMKKCWENGEDVGHNRGHEIGDTEIANKSFQEFISSLPSPPSK